MPVSRRTLLPALLGAIASIPRLASAADDVVTRASPYSPLPKPESEPAVAGEVAVAMPAW